ncbi:hypothetical protein M0811_04115 [Anaeramoeba ignava]|uniref:PAS fold domain-containing protein n=1 Tax=Anaeramoeba ignava TaxID=1746090 RepID=A0A9Q0LVL2_ANAIG|nr:hypothetical protein M0811_04115 [Anaeramoeba ignava]
MRVKMGNYGTVNRKVTHKKKKAYLKMVHSRKEPITIVHESGIFIECNQAAADLFETTISGLCGINPSELSPPSQPQLNLESGLAVETTLRKIFASKEKKYDFDWLHLTTKREEFWVHIWGTPMIFCDQLCLQCIYQKIPNPLEDSKVEPLEMSNRLVNIDLSQDSQVTSDRQSTTSYNAVMTNEEDEELTANFEHSIEGIKDFVRSFENSKNGKENC